MATGLSRIIGLACRSRPSISAKPLLGKQPRPKVLDFSHGHQKEDQEETDEVEATRCQESRHAKTREEEETLSQACGEEGRSQESGEEVRCEEEVKGKDGRVARLRTILLATGHGKLIFMAHKKGQGTSRNGRDSNAQRLGFKAFGGQIVPGGTIIVRQRGTPVKPGLNVGRGKDDTLFAKVTGRIKFLNKGSMGKFVMVEPMEVAE